MSELLGKYYGKETTKLYESVINQVLKKKYEWFDHIIVHRLSFSKSQDYLGIVAELFADEDWVGKQWREFYYSKPMPSGTEDDPIILSELIGVEFSKELQDDFKTVFMFITSEKRPKYMSHSWIEVKSIEMNENKLTEQILRINELLANDKTALSYVVFVSGLESSINHAGQTQIFTQNFTKKYPIKSFNYSNKNGISNFIKNNNIVAVILFSKGCELVSQINVPSQKIFCIEPWNGKKTDAGTAYRYSSIPAGNMYIDYEDFNRGKGTKKGANPTSHKNNHFGALASSAKSISEKI